jgi:hypothetical protein
MTGRDVIVTCHSLRRKENVARKRKMRTGGERFAFHSSQAKKKIEIELTFVA